MENATGDTEESLRDAEGLQEHLFSASSLATRAKRETGGVMQILLLGLGVGILVGLMGVGGGIVLVPALVYLLGFTQHMAQGTSLLLQLPPIGIGALVFYWKQKRVDVRAGVWCAVGFLAGGYFGSDVALGISKENLQALFGLFLMVAAALLFRQARKKAEDFKQDADKAAGHG